MSNTNNININSERRLGLLTYALLGVGISFIPLLLAALGFGYWRKSYVEGTYLSSHYQWQIRTFWYFLVVFLIGVGTAYFGIGYYLIGFAALLVAVRTLFGSYKLFKCQPVRN